MKKIIISIMNLILIFTILAITGCTNENGYDSKSFLTFLNIDDFRKYVATGSMNVEDYENVEIIPYYTTFTDETPKPVYVIDKNTFIDIDDIFSNNDFTSEFKCVEIYKDGSYIYKFKNGVNVAIYYNDNYSQTDAIDTIENFNKINKNKNKITTNYLTAGSVKKQIIDNEEFNYAISDIGKYTVAYDVTRINDNTVSRLGFNTSIDKIYIYLYLQFDEVSGDYYNWNFDELLSDPKCDFVASLFSTSDVRNSAFSNLVTAVENREYKGG